MVFAPPRATLPEDGDRAGPGDRAARPTVRRTEYPAAIRELIMQLRQMPGVGPRSAERIALWIVQARQGQPESIAQAITQTRGTIRPCVQCGFFATAELCEICADDSRARDLLCVVEQATDILPLEKTSAFRGRYHSLGGRISPLDRVAPEDLRIASLLERVERKRPRNHFRSRRGCGRGGDDELSRRTPEKIPGNADSYRARTARRRRARIGR